MLKPLQGIKVLDLTWVYAGPHATMLLYDLGAEIVKVEGPPFGDHTRIFPPFKNGSSGYFYQINRGKKSIALNMKKPEGKKIFLELIEHFDVVTENFLPGTLDKLGIGYEEMKRANPRIIYASISGFGSWGPYADRPCVDPVAQAMGGLMSLTGFPDGPPLKTGPAVADALAGTYLAVGILAALRQRDQSGIGQRLEVSMMDSVFSVLEESVIRTSMTGDPLPARGNTDPLGAPWDAFPAQGGKWIMVCAVGGDSFYKLYHAIGRGDIAEEYKGNDYSAIERRSQNLSELNNIFAEWTKTKTVDEIHGFLTSMRIPSGEVKHINELLEDPHLIARNMVVPIDHPKLGKVKTFNTPIYFFENPVGIGKVENPLDPELGEHSADVLKTFLSYKDEAINSLKEEGIIWA